jgi:hypothetical protein
MPRKIKRLFFFFFPSRGRVRCFRRPKENHLRCRATYRFYGEVGVVVSRETTALRFSRRVHPVLHGNTVRSHRLRPESRGLRFYSSSNCHLHTVRRGSLELFNNLRRTRSASVVHGTGRSSLRSALRHQRLYSSTITN